MTFYLNISLLWLAVEIELCHISCRAMSSIVKCLTIYSHSLLMNFVYNLSPSRLCSLEQNILNDSSSAHTQPQSHNTCIDDSREERLEEKIKRKVIRD